MNLPQEAIVGGGSVPLFLRKPLATCDFPFVVWTPCPLSDSAHLHSSCLFFRFFHFILTMILMPLQQMSYAFISAEFGKPILQEI